MITTPTEHDTPNETPDPAELLIEEARRKARRRRLTTGAVVLVIAVVIAAVLAAIGHGTANPNRLTNGSLGSAVTTN